MESDDNLTLGEVVSAWLGWITVGLVVYVVVGLLSAVLISRKAGYSHWLGVIAVAVPLLGPLLVLVFAFLKWPALKQRDAALALLAKNGLSIESPKRAANEKPN